MTKAKKPARAAKASAAPTVTITLEDKARATALASVAFITGGDTAPSRISGIQEALDAAAFANEAADAAQQNAARLAGGALGLGVALVLFVSQTVNTGKGKTLQNAANYVQEHSAAFAFATQKSVAKLLAESCRYTAGSTDVSVIWLECLSLVRQGMAQHGSLKAWEKVARAERDAAGNARAPHHNGKAEGAEGEEGAEGTAPAKKAGRPKAEKPVTVSDLKAGNSLELIGGAETLFAEIAKRAIENTDATCADYLSAVTVKALEAYEAAMRAADKAAALKKRRRKAA